MSNDPPRRGIRPWLVVPLVLVAALVGYLIATGNGGGTSAGDAEAAGVSSKVTRSSGDSVIRSHDGSGAVNLRACPGPPAAGETYGCGIVDTLPDGALVKMECWIDGRPVPGRAPTDTRWFLVTPGAGAPHPGRRGYVFSAEIPVEEQVRTPWCSNDLINKLIAEPEPTFSATTAKPAPSTQPPTSRPAAPTTTPPPPTAVPPIVDPPPPPTTAAPAAAVMVTVDNRVTDGASMREDTAHPAYLSTQPVKRCKAQNPACNVPGDLASGDRLTALCQVIGDEVTNGWDGDDRDNDNPGLATSSLWYKLRADDGRTGYLSVVWLASGDRDGRGLPTC
ncbi:hypothetical protein [Streptomyces griseosporeus]|uniref:hypothetical protein n=1 Tax=Streptomyces griseosporeus TaxID=1910 RepID=UPI0036F66E01